MRLVVAVVVSAAILSVAFAQSGSISYWLLSKGDGRTWCGFASESTFKEEVMRLQPAETVRVTYSADKLTDLTYQVEPESGDWVVVDTYTPSGDGLVLRRANLLTQPNLEVIQETTIRGGKAAAFHLVNVTTLDGKKADESDASNIDYPNVPVMTDLIETPFVAVVSQMRRQAVPTLCKKRG